MQLPSLLIAFALALPGLGTSPSAGPVASGGANGAADAAAAPRGSGPTEVDIQDLTGIDWGPGDDLPQSVLDYNGVRVVIAGYMHQSIEDTTSKFPLVSEACQCTGLLMPHHFIEVDLGPNETEPIPGQFEVIGTLSVGVEEDEDGFVTSVYRLRGRIY